MEVQNVLILGESSRRALIGALRILADDPRVRLHFGVTGLNFSKRALLSSYPEVGVFHLDFRSPELFVGSLLDLVSNIGPYIILPSDEYWLRIILANRQVLEERGIRMRCPEEAIYARVSDKGSFAALCQEHGLEVPQECDFPKSYSFPFVVKARRLEKSAGILEYPFLVENQKAFSLLQKKNIDISKHFCQQLIVGPSYYYCAFYDKGKLLFNFSQINLCQQPGGKSVIKARPASLPDGICNKIDSIFADLEWDGVIMFELKQDLSSGRYYAIECNPRLWGPSMLCIDNGLDIFSPLCFLPPKNLGNPDKIAGYLWTSGYIEGFFTGLKMKSRFQSFDEPPSLPRVRYKSVWWRKDTMVYAIAETLTVILKGLRSVFAGKP
jgi:predicted ATP-grasp superfamily ATP-dependent carboligase